MFQFMIKMRLAVIYFLPFNYDNTQPHFDFTFLFFFASFTLPFSSAVLLGDSGGVTRISLTGLSSLMGEFVLVLVFKLIFKFEFDSTVVSNFLTGESADWSFVWLISSDTERLALLLSEQAFLIRSFTSRSVFVFRSFTNWSASFAKLPSGRNGLSDSL